MKVKELKRSVMFLLIFVVFLFPVKANAMWQKTNAGWKYWDEKEQEFSKGLKKIGTQTFYFDNITRVMQTGWRRIGGAQYYFRDNGVMATNAWISGRYYVGKDGKMVKGKWLALDGQEEDEKIYFNQDGIWLKGYRTDVEQGFQKDANGYKYMNYDGEYLAAGWKMVEGAWRYFYENGYMATSKWMTEYCYVDEQGRLARDQWVDDKYIGKNGRWNPSVQKEEK